MDGHRSNVVHMRATRKQPKLQTYQGRTLTHLPTGEIECNGRRFDSSLVARMSIDAGLI